MELINITLSKIIRKTKIALYLTYGVLVESRKLERGHLWLGRRKILREER